MAELTLDQQRALALSRSRQRQAAEAAQATSVAASGVSTAQPVADTPVSRFNDPRGAALTLGSQAVAEPVAGLAGLLAMVPGFVGGLVPGGETPKNKALRFGTGTIEAVKDALTIDPVNVASERALESVGKGAEALTKGVRTPVAGIAGLAQLPFSGVEGATETIRRTTEEGIGPTAGAGLERIGAPPFVSAVAETVPVGIATVAGVKNPLLRRTPEPPPARPTLAAAEGPQVSVGRPGLDKPVDVTPVSAQRIVDDLKKGKTVELAAEVVPDVKVIESAQRLGVDLNVEHYATSTAFQDVARALKSKPGSELLAGEVQALRDLSTRADDLVTDIGGSLDKAAVSDDILNNTRTTIDNLQERADIAYSTVRETIPKATRVETQLIKDYLDAKLVELGGNESLLTTIEKKLFNLVTRKEGDGSITYAAIDRVRRDVGDGFNKRSGPFKDDGDFILREVYGVLSDTQNGVAEAFGIGALYTEARGLVTKRKGLEDQAVELFGRNASGSLVPRIRAAATGLPKGDVTAFNRLIDALPKARRGEVAAQVLNELFSGGSRQGGQLGTGFANTWRNLNRNTTARDALYRHLPEGTPRRIDDIGRVMDAIVRSNAKPMANPSGSAAGIIRALEDASLATRLYTGGKAVATTAAMEGIAFGVGVPPGIATVARTAVAIGKKKKGPDVDAVRAADDLLSSQTFKDAVGEAVSGNTARANTIVEGSPQFKRWAATLEDGDVARLASVGFIGYVSGEGDNGR